ncbi:hypothetical protein TI39_contig4162g00007 [Zymoseptoria brevis]|uniref:Uncharacterized protein n=1 Tax=Zymoseptoria brevis TaxID=1047168 RepID=A0A0F4GCJ2_9PEZI|nr:hypothetical protein TI39_contig4162g00007 [Zymoseptoria brevis]
MSNTNNDLNCDLGGGLSIIRNTTGTPICGFQTLSNTSLLSSCCGNNDFESYGCAQYCSTQQFVGQFAQCISDAADGAAIRPLGVFCQDGLAGNTTDKLPSTGGALRTPSSFWLRTFSWTLILSLVLSAQAQAPSSCSVQKSFNYTATHNVSTIVSPRFSSSDSPENRPICPFPTPVSVPPFHNNRTIDGTSAAGSEYDEFFTALEGVAGRHFPAASGLELQYEFLGPTGQAFRISFTPLTWCTIATTNYASVVGDAPGGNRTVQACGPLFVSDVDTKGDGGGGDAPQGTLSIVLTD